jgi:hypothetical protein
MKTFHTVPKGKYTAKPMDWRIANSTKKGTPFAEVKFEFNEEDGSRRVLNWQGYLTDKTKERTLKTLIVMGFKDDDFGRFMKGAEGGALSKESVEIVVDHEEVGEKTYARIRFVNPPGGAKFAALASDPAAAIDIKGDMAALKAEFGITGESAPTETFDDLPF